MPQDESRAGLQFARVARGLVIASVDALACGSSPEVRAGSQAQLDTPDRLPGRAAGKPIRRVQLGLRPGTDLRRTATREGIDRRNHETTSHPRELQPSATLVLRHLSDIPQRPRDLQ